MITSCIPYQGHHIYYDVTASIADNTIAPILLLGGVLQNRRSWDSYVREISPLTMAITIDLPGIGDAGVLDDSFGFDFLSDCIYEVITSLRIPKINIFSTSYSSIIAYEFSAKYTDLVDKLIISSSMAMLPNEQKQVMLSCVSALERNDLELFYSTFIDGVCHPDKAIANYDLSRKVIRKLTEALTPQEVSQFVENTKRVLQYEIPEAAVNGIELSPLVFTGSHDTFTPPNLCRDIGKYYTKSYFGTIDNYDHLFHIGNRKTIVQNILPFFEKGKIPSFVHNGV